MRILLDECLPRRLGRLFVGHQIKTVQQMNWAGIKNGRLLSLAQQRFDVFVTVDRGVTHQQHLADFEIGVVVLSSRSNQIDELSRLVPEALKVIETLPPGTFVVVAEPSGSNDPHLIDPPDENILPIDETT